MRKNERLGEQYGVSRGHVTVVGAVIFNSFKSFLAYTVLKV